MWVYECECEYAHPYSQIVMAGSQIVTQSTGMATIPMSSPAKTFLLPFGKNQHLVPEGGIVSYPKKPNVMPSAEALGALLATKAPEKWLPYCKPNTLLRIQGETGNCVYTTFSVEGYPEEKRILRFISSAIAEKNFKLVKETEKVAEVTNERQQIRMDVLNWTKEADCPMRAQISPEIEKWPVADATEAIKSCAKVPESKKRAKPGSSQVDEMAAMRRQYICSEQIIKVPPESTYRVNEVDGLLHVLFYRKAPLTGPSNPDDDDDDQ